MALARYGASTRLPLLALCVSLGLGVTSRAETDATAREPVAHGTEAKPSDEACRQQAIQTVQKRYEGIRDLRARFVQTTQGAVLDQRATAPSVSRGSVVVAKPSRMRWSYEAPDPSLVVSDGKTLWIYDPGFREVQRAPVDGGFFSAAALQFLLGRGDMEREFEVRLVSCETAAVELELTPRAPSSYEKLRIVADPRTGNVSRTRIDDLLGNSTIVDFSELEVNLDPPAELFRFDPPKGVRVIDLAPPDR